VARSPEHAPGLCRLDGLRSAEKFGTLTRGGRAYSAIMVLIITLLILGAILLFLETLLPGMIAGIIGVCWRR
jgi:hypothetical protein